MPEVDLTGLPQPTQAKALRYWFDDDGGSVKTITQLSGNQTFDVSTLLEGLHTIHYQLIDSKDIAGAISSCVFIKMGAVEGSSASSLRCWFDDDANSVKTVSSTNGIYTLDVSTLTEGLHTVHYQVIGSDGKANFIASSIFMKMKSSEGALTASKLYYWYDDETVIKQVNVSQSVQTLDASMLNAGLHTVHYQVLCNNGELTPVASTVFLRVNFDSATTIAKSLRYWFDDETTVMQAAITDGVQLLDASKLNEGLHTVHYQIVDSKDNLGSPVSSIFMKMNSQSSSEAKSIRYWFDDDHASFKVTDVANGTQSLDVTDLQTGLHTLHYQLVDNQGNMGATVSCIFLKDFDKVIPDGQNRITQYQYWLNKNSSAMNTVNLSNANNPYQLISLIPLQKEPINSQLFHFDVTDGQPTVYAKNIFNIRFHDAKGYFADEHHPFIDYSVKQKVETVGELQATQTFSKMAENDIRWYTMQVAPGDTTAFRLSQAATLQVFAPSGKEVFNTSESASVQWGGIHTWEYGTYYVAVHDVTGSQSNLTLDYMHMDKYDVVDWDVHTVGNGGCSTITFKGNGFRDLYRVDLYTADGDSIHSVDISHDSDAETSVTFDFSGAELGVYNAVFHFTQEDKRFTNIVTVEEAVDIELATNVTFPSTFLRGTSTTYTIKITNKGNMTAYAVPIYTWIKTVSKDGVKHIKFEGLNLPDIFALTDLDTLNASDIQKLKDLEISLGAEPYFLKSMVSSDDNNNDSICIRTNYSCVSIPPYSTRTIQLTIAASETVDVWFTIPDKWMVYSSEIFDNIHRMSSRKARSTVEDYYCCYKEHIECFLENVSTACDIVSPVLAIAAPWLARVRPDIGLAAEIAALEVALTGCLSSLTNDGLKTFGNTLCESESDDALKRLKEALRAANSASYSVGSILSCVGAVLSVAGLPKHILSDCLSAAGNALAGAALGNDLTADDTSCKKSREKKPGCPPIPPTGGSSTPQPPSDPNDIYGYLSDAGSKFMTDEVAKVNYTIEFENDTAFAQASAHTIVIRDTLDSRYFDLKSFLPTSVKIGEREAFLDEATDVKTSGSVTSFLKTIDMRPEINALAQVQGEYSQQMGIAKWTFTSLDPMTMEPTDDLMQGILPVNYNGTSGIGEVMFEVGVKPNKADGTQIPNRAGIVFDYEEPILTPIWVNIVDATAPNSHVTDVKMLNDSTATVSISATDELSGCYRYDVYVQYGKGSSWFKAAENVRIDTTAYVKIYDGIDHGFYVLVTDSAGNVEKKEAAREFSLVVGEPNETVGDTNGDEKVNVADIVAILNYLTGRPNEKFILGNADVNGDGEVNIADVISITNRIMTNATRKRRAVYGRKD